MTDLPAPTRFFFSGPPEMVEAIYRQVEEHAAEQGWSSFRDGQGAVNVTGPHGEVLEYAKQIYTLVLAPGSTH